MGILSFFSRNGAADYKSLVAGGALLLDVRSEGEYAAGHIPGSINIPLPALAPGIPPLKDHDRPVITCCKSGIRSAMACRILRKAGIVAYNGGAWKQLHKKIQ